MDFYRIKERPAKNGIVEIYVDFKVVRSDDLMVKDKQFYAIWDARKNLWSKDEYDVQRLIDEDLQAHREKLEAKNSGIVYQVKFLGDFSSATWLQYRNYVGHLSNSFTELDRNLTFANTEIKKADYVSKRLPYALTSGDHSAWDEIISTLYTPEERAKIEWAIGAVVSGDSKTIQKFLVFYGAPGTGKGTILNIILKLFTGYSTTFEASALVSGNNQFAMDVFRDNPLVAVQQDGDLSKIADNSRLNSITAHEDMTINEKFKAGYTGAILAFLFMGTNKPVKITDAKSGIIRRLIDVQPSGHLISPRRYQALMSQIDFELGAIAAHCLELYRQMGKNYYKEYRPVEMMLQTDYFYNYIEQYFDVFSEQNGCTLNQAWDLYKAWCTDSEIEYKLPRPKFREELRNYFETFEERAVIDGARVRSWYGEFITDQFKVQVREEPVFSLTMDETVSIFDKVCAAYPAQLANHYETPSKPWAEITTVLSDLNTNDLHYVKVPENHIVIDFDLKDENGHKSAELNLEAASKWPPTYAEFSKGGGGVHLHYNYAGDSSELGRIFAEGIEVKVFTGNSSLRRRLSKCNNVPIATLSSGLPLKEKKMANVDHIKSERSLRALIERNLQKEIHPGTKSSVDFIHKILDDAHASGMAYDVTDMRNRIMAFANNSTNQAVQALMQVQKMKFKGKDVPEGEPEFEFAEDEPVRSVAKPKDDRLVIYDVEVFPNLFIVCWKYLGSPNIVRMINPTPQQIEELLGMNLVGFNNRRYDNHILYGRFMGYNNEQLYKLSKKMIDGVPNATFGEAYDLSYADIFDYSSKKQSLKKFQIELGLKHLELGLPWDEPVPEELWDKVAEYCDNDVVSTEAVFDDRKQDLVARQILADLSGLPVNATTAKHTAKIIFEGNRKAQEEFVYTDLSEMFPGYEFDLGKSHYKGELVGEGGYVYAEKGMYENVALLDVASMHPTSAIELNLFGDNYTKNFEGLLKARLAIKNKKYDEAKQMLGGMLAKHLRSEDDAKALSDALKIVVNIVYGLTSASFDNPFRDRRNIDNIVAKRGALFMIELKEYVQSRGFTVAHIKTDSIKIPNATPEIIDEVMEFGEKYGYTFEHEATYEKFCLVNDAVYIAYVAAGRKPAHWEAVGAQFQHPYVFKHLFTHETPEFKDLCEAKFVKASTMYLDFSDQEDDTPMAFAENKDKLHFIGKAGLFCPIKKGRGGAKLVSEKEGKFSAVSGTKGYDWLESDMVETLGKHDDIEVQYFVNLVDAAVDKISLYGDFERFVEV